MYLYMKQKVFSWKDRFTIKDAGGSDRYTVEGKLLSVGKKLFIYDKNGEEAAFVHQKVLSLLPKFYVDVHGETVAEIVKKFTFFKPKYVVNGLGWEIEGDMFAHDYVVREQGRPVVSVHKRWMAWGDTFELDIEDPQKEIYALAVVLAIDAVMDAQSAAAASASN